jgi:hypothetical protein
MGAAVTTMTFMRAFFLPFGAVACVAVTCVACADEQLVEVPDEPEPNIEAEEEPSAIEEPAPEEPEPPANSGDECSSDDDCGGDTVCEAGTCVGQGVLRITLTFEMDTDLDLHVITPSGEEVYFGNPSAAGGVLDVDTCVGLCDDEPVHVENVFFNESLDTGFYEVYVVNFDGRQGGSFRIDVAGAAELSVDGSLSATFGATSESLEFFLTD